MTWPSSAPDRPGLAAAVYAASEGLSVLVLDCRAFGGQAGASARIENYLGFPTGITGMALMARAYNQAQKFGVEMAIPDEVDELAGADVRIADAAFAHAREQRTRSRPRRRHRQRRALSPPRRRQSRRIRGLERALLGVAAGGDGCAPGRRWRWSAPAIRPARRRCIWPSQVAKVWLIVRGPSLDASMSRYLRGVASMPNIEVLAQTTVNALEGQDGILRQSAVALTDPVKK